jgi:Protein of unknown function (DUF1501)
MSSIPRRRFFTELGMGFPALVLAEMLHRDGFARADETSAAGWKPPDGRPHFTPRAKNVIWLFMIGGTSHLESFDPKPALNRYAGKTIAETPFADTLKNKLTGNLRVLLQDQPELHVRRTLYPLQVGSAKRGEAGIEISDWWPCVGSCVDQIAVIRSMWTTDNDHGAQLQFHTGRHMLEGQFPTIGSWVHYGLGSLSDDLPRFVVLGSPIADCCGGMGGHGASYLGPEHDGIQLSVDPQNPLPFATPAKGVFQEEQAGEFELLGRLNQLSALKYPLDSALRARIKSYELAFRMQTAVPEVMQLSREAPATEKLYGLDQDVTRGFGRMCLTARRMVERGVRFVQVFHGSNGGAGGWDAHSDLRQNHADQCAQVDRPIAGLLTDLKQRGLLDETIVVWATEFGRTPGSEGKDGRDHHPYGFSVWMAGGGIKGGIIHGATDEIGYHATVDRHYVTDIHATLLHQLGLDPRRLEVPGHKRLEIDFGQVIRDILA